MKTEKRLFGDWGEEMAARYLTHRDYRILDRNVMYGSLELDIVAEWLGEIIFVEVKTRRSESFSKAEDAVDMQKQQNIREAAHAYMLHHGLHKPFRYDVMTVVGNAESYEVKHIKRAF